jgi:uncharacterized protein YndB with AHSA1/START domain
MGYEFSGAHEADVDATVDDVWHAIATGPGITSWFMGATEVRDGAVHLPFGGQPITVSEPGRRFVYRGDPEPDGRFIAFDYLIEGRAGGSTSIRLVSNGFLPGDDWAEEYDAMTKGGAMFFASLVEYLNHFAGRVGIPMDASSSAIDDWDGACDALGRSLGLSGRPKPGDTVRIAIDGRNVDGVVYYTNEDTFAVRGDDALYRFVKAFRPGGHGPMLAMHILFGADADVPRAERAWSEWLAAAIG